MAKIETFAGRTPEVDAQVNDYGQTLHEIAEGLQVVRERLSALAFNPAHEVIRRLEGLRDEAQTTLRRYGDEWPF